MAPKKKNADAKTNATGGHEAADDGRWTCEGCDEPNRADRQACNNCGAASPSAQASASSAGTAPSATAATASTSQAAAAASTTAAPAAAAAAAPPLPPPVCSEQDPKGLYSTLGVEPTADAAEIRKSYRRLALRWHPDKNQDDPSATEQFQRISSAYEVLSDAEKRDMYDTTGCIDEEELAENDDPFDLFAAFFGGMGGQDMDEEEQAMMDDFMRMVGGSAFKSSGRRRRGKKGRGGRGGGRRGGRGSDEDMEEAFLKAMSGGMGLSPGEPVCPQDHELKRRKADKADYECDVCEKDIATGKRFYDCRKCDWSICSRCYKEAQAAAEAQQEDDDDELLDQDAAEILEAFCEMNTSVVRKGRRLTHKCEICQAELGSEDKVFPHMQEKHTDEIEEFMEDAMGGGRAGPSFPGMSGMGGGGMEELLMGMMGGGMMPGMPGQGYPGASRGPPRNSGSRKKR